MAEKGIKKNAKKEKAKEKLAKKDASLKTESATFRQKLDNLTARYENYILIAGGVFILAVLAVLRFSFYYVEGIASIALLIIAIAFLWRSKDIIYPIEYSLSGDSVLIWIGAFAFLGYVFDGAGNFIYNKPLGLFCSPAAKLMREVTSVDTIDGTELVQVFSCVSRIDGEATEIAWYLVDLIRIFEYIALGFVLVAVFRAFLWWKTNR